MKSIVFFNNKGGVGKTTLASNLVAYLNMHRNKRVLLVDADPQCNATQMMLDEYQCEGIYFDNSSDIDTLYTSLKPLEDGDAAINLNITPTLGTQNRFQTDLIPGHPMMSIVEDRLSDAWSDLRAREIRGYRITNWCNQLTKRFEEQYDFIVFDVGPSLGALNRSVILASDFIVTPFGCDIFSLLGIQNIAGWIKTWQLQYESSVIETSNQNPEIFEKFSIIDDTSKKFRFAGYSVQQYVTRKFKDGPRPVKSYDRIMAKIPTTVDETMRFLYPEGLEEYDFALGHIPYVYSLVPMAQAAKAPIHALGSSDGVAGGNYKAVESYSKLMGSLCDKLLTTMEKGQ